eukprot:3174304-Prymnesium_polylepis.1
MLWPRGCCGHAGVGAVARVGRPTRQRGSAHPAVGTPGAPGRLRVAGGGDNPGGASSGRHGAARRNLYRH